MIRTALEFIQKELTSFILEREFDDPAMYNATNIVDVKPVALPNGTINITEGSHITLMLAGLEEERREGKRPYYVQTEDKKFNKFNPPIEIDLCLLFAAHNNHYPTALRDLSHVIAFFQSNPVFDEQKYPGLNAQITNAAQKPWQLIDRLSFRLHSLSFEQQNNLWSMMGTKYIPNVVYKVNMLTVFDNRAKEKAAAITELKIGENA